MKKVNHFNILELSKNIVNSLKKMFVFMEDVMEDVNH